MAGKNGVKHRPVLPVSGAGDISVFGSQGDMDSFNLKPAHSTSQIPGKCLKCLAEQELNNCLMQLLRGDQTGDSVGHKYETLVNFLQSSDSEKLRAESERYLSEGKEVAVKIYFADGKPKYELKVEE